MTLARSKYLDYIAIANSASEQVTSTLHSYVSLLLGLLKGVLCATIIMFQATPCMHCMSAVSTAFVDASHDSRADCIIRGASCRCISKTSA